MAWGPGPLVPGDNSIPIHVLWIAIPIGIALGDWVGAVIY